ncbi:Stp1/IreP family PP2C-type Ser/Thr phosphatase [Melaminivora alkalimesophila]|uniref:Protein phosphatase n=1 Tax=Melaminivora alkalimesophila TaxID=1165852 RepID=A0A317RB81_9BURK|nr:Stp1/IreP family PP2C-type Ser/Thr phosphatase [Melaminivora alkalimesophila]PWW46764.1 protein phosphatase [Melaminivora alkalimesophila]
MASDPPSEFHALTDRGRVRPANEDAVAVHPAVGLMLLADGMGGYNAGEVAAQMAVEGVGRAMETWLQGPEGQAATAAEARARLEACIQDANQAILAAARSQPQCAGMGTTLVAGLLHGERLLLAHIGDSRCYRLRAGELQQLTRDHSWLQEQIDAGVLTPVEAALSGLRNLVTRALGVEEPAPLEMQEFDTQPGDLYLLCSDGLTDRMQPKEIAELARAPVSLADKAERLVALANALGGRDNISVVLAQLPPAPGEAFP